VGVVAASFLGLPYSVAAAVQTPGDFSLQVTPSPLVATVKPGQTTELELKIRNAGSQTEKLKIEPRRFSFSSKTGEVQLNDSAPPENAGWTDFSAPRFTVEPNRWFTQKIRISPPENAGFSYSFALVISRDDTETPQPARTSGVLKGSLAVFTLINVDRPGATKKLEIVEFAASKGVYEALPAELNLRLKNTGNTVIQPAGDLFIQRDADDTAPISTLPVNRAGSYILPGSTRTLQATWENGFQVYKTTRADDGTEKRQLTWNWSNLSKLRFGRYTAKVIVVYNDGRRDIPVEGVVSFWVIPWKLLLIVLLVLSLIAAGLWTWVRFGIRIFNRHKPTALHRRKHRN
jgi:hypothetical protein